MPFRFVVKAYDNMSPTTQTLLWVLALIAFIAAFLVYPWLTILCIIFALLYAIATFIRNYVKAVRDDHNSRKDS